MYFWEPDKIPKRGMMKLDQEKLEKLLPECGIVVYDEVDSTNTQAKRRAHEGAFGPMLFVAESQSAGRGRQGKSFYSPKDTGLYMTLLYPAGGQVFDAVRITAKASAAVVRGLQLFTKVPLAIKWVNDILLEGKKICGILCESVTEEDNVTLKGLVIGVGVNLSTEDFPEDIQNIAGSLKNRDIDKNVAAASIAKELIFEASHLQDTTYLSLYRERSCVLGREIVYTKDGESIRAFAKAIDDNGALVVIREDGKEAVLTSGEISVRVRGET